jgi:hypothetical protein
MATCKNDCIHYSVCSIWDRSVFVDYDMDILSDFSDLPNVEEYCKNYLSKELVPRLRAYENITRLCSKCKKEKEEEK